MARPEPLVSAALLVLAVALIALIVAVLAFPGDRQRDVETLTTLMLSLLLIIVLFAAAIWGQG